MATLSSSQSSSSFLGPACEEDNEKFEQKYFQLVAELPREKGWLSEHIHQYQGFWYSTQVCKGLLILQKHFQANPNDVLLACYPKSGTTWLKALLFTIINRKCFDPLTNPLLTANPHELVALLELYANVNPENPRPSSSLMSTHISYTSLPDSVKTSGCRIVYVFRDPKDALVSCWHFQNKLRSKELPPISLAEAFEQFSRGASPYGPYWDHVMEFWKASKESPDRVFFLSYEDLKKEPCFHVKRLAQFLGHAFSTEEDNEGVVSKVVEFCSFENLSNLEVNKTGTHSGGSAFPAIENAVFFRKAKVGDSKNHLSREMIELLDQITEQKFKDYASNHLFPRGVSNQIDKIS